MSPKASQMLVKEIVPRLRYAVPRVAMRVRTEDIEELVQDATAIAAGMLHRAEEKGKEVTAGNIAHYTLLRLKEGRRSTGSGKADVYQTRTQLMGRSRLFSEETLHHDHEHGEILTLADMITLGQGNAGHAARATSV